MTQRHKTKFIHEGRYVAEIDVEIIEDETSWSPYLAVSDARRMDLVRAALRRGDLQAASSEARIYIMQPVVATA